MNENFEYATLGGGCFWCLDAALKQLRGVVKITSGYSGGAAPKPTYTQVCSGDSGHAEVVQISFDPQQISYRVLLEAFFAIHDPTTPNRQGNDVGSQYRSVIFIHTPEQEKIARELIAEYTAERIWPGSIVTEVLPLTTFWPGEVYHQDYFAHNPQQPYCQAVVAPKAAKLRQKFAALLKNP